MLTVDWAFLYLQFLVCKFLSLAIFEYVQHKAQEYSMVTMEEISPSWLRRCRGPEQLVELVQRTRKRLRGIQAYISSTCPIS